MVLTEKAEDNRADGNGADAPSQVRTPPGFRVGKWIKGANI